MAGKSRAVRAGRAFYELYADKSLLGKTMKGAEALVKASAQHAASLSKKLFAAGAGIAAGVAASVKLWAKQGAELTDISRRTGASAGALQSLGYAAQRTGSDIGAVESALTSVRSKMVDAARGSEEAQLAFARLGLNFLELSQLKPEDRLRAIAQQLNQIPDPALRAAAAEELLGSADLLPTLNQLGELEQRAHDLGLVLSDEDYAAAKKFDQGLADIWASLKNVAVLIGGAVAPIVEEWAASAASAVKDWRGGIDSLIAKWYDWKMAFQTAALEAFYGALHIANDVWAGIRHGWQEFLHFFVSSWREVQNSISQGVLDIMGFFDSSLDVEGAKQILNQDFAKEQSQRDENNSAEHRRIMADQEARAAGLIEERNTAIAGVETENQANLQAARQRMSDLLDRMDNFKREALDSQKAAETAATGSTPGIGGAVHHVKGIGAQDVRSKEGFQSVAASLRQQTLQQRSYNLQERQFVEERRTRQAVESLKTRDF